MKTPYPQLYACIYKMPNLERGINLIIYEIILIFFFFFFFQKLTWQAIYSSAPVSLPNIKVWCIQGKVWQMDGLMDEQSKGQYAHSTFSKLGP